MASQCVTSRKRAARDEPNDIHYGENKRKIKRAKLAEAQGPQRRLVPEVECVLMSSRSSLICSF